MAIVNRVIGDCPNCGQVASFGNVMVRGYTLNRGCGRCTHWETIELPLLRKKIVYLDQSLLSSAFKGRDQRSVMAVDRVTSLATKQLLVAPHSDIHENETFLWSGHAQQTPEQLLRFIKHAARGLQFRSHYEIETRQAHRAFMQFRNDKSARLTLDVKDAFHDDPHEWHNYVYVSINRPPFDPALQRQQKEQSVRDLVSAFDAWRSTVGTFDDDVAYEIQDAGRTYLQHYTESLRRSFVGDISSILNTTNAAEVTRMLIGLLPREMPIDKSLHELMNFFQSDHFAQMPHLAISARIFAQLRQMARAGAYPTRERAEDKLRGTLDDIRHVATFAPYCDAVFIDNSMADILSRPDIGLNQQFGTRVFALSSLDDFHDWLDEVEAGASAIHFEFLERVYGTKP